MATRRERLTARREALGYTQESFAHKLGVELSTVGRWERGTLTPQPWRRSVVAHALEVSLDELDSMLTDSNSHQENRELAAPPEVDTTAHDTDSGVIVDPTTIPPPELPRFSGQRAPVMIDRPPFLVNVLSRDNVLDPAAGHAPHEALLGVLDHARVLVDETLSKGSASCTRLDRIDERVAGHVLTYTRRAPLGVLAALTPDLIETQTLAAQRQPAVAQARLSEATAVLALLSADALMKLGQVNRARYWYSTACQAADDTFNPELQARVRAQKAMLPYYYGRLEHTVSLAQAAQALLPSSRCDTAALAAAAEARALARLGDHDGAERAMARAERVVDQLDRPSTHAAFQFTEQRLLLYLSGTLTYMGQTARARRVQAQAAQQYRNEPAIVIDPALIQLDQAVCEAQDGNIDDACQLAAATLEQLPDEHRTKIVAIRALDVVEAVPLQHRVRPAVGQLRQLAAPKP